MWNEIKTSCGLDELANSTKEIKLHEKNSFWHKSTIAEAREALLEEIGKESNCEKQDFLKEQLGALIRLDKSYEKFLNEKFHERTNSDLNNLFNKVVNEIENGSSITDEAEKIEETIARDKDIPKIIKEEIEKYKKQHNIEIAQIEIEEKQELEKQKNNLGNILKKINPDVNIKLFFENFYSEKFSIYETIYALEIYIKWGNSVEDWNLFEFDTIRISTADPEWNTNYDIDALWKNYWKERKVLWGKDEIDINRISIDGSWIFFDDVVFQESDNHHPVEKEFSDYLNNILNFCDLKIKKNKI